MTRKLSEEGEIKRTSEGVLVRALGGAHLLDQPGVECENPDVPEGERIYRKLFVHRQIFLPGEFDAAQAFLGGNDVIRLGATGYSTIKDEQLAEWGLRRGAYEAAVKGLIMAQTRFIWEHFEGAQVKLCDGASYMGVDQAMIEAGKALNLNRLGHSCPKFMFYVHDDSEDQTPIYVASTQAEYSTAFVTNCDILLSVGGRLQALEHDITAGIKLGYMGKAVVPINLLEAICDHGGPPAWGADGSVQDATAAYTKTVFPIPMAAATGGADMYDLIRQHVCAVAGNLCRRKLSPDRAYAGSRH